MNNFFNEILKENTSRVNNFFYNSCKSNYDYKVFLTRRAYALYKIFVNEYKKMNYKIDIKGEVYNSHSLPLLLNKNDLSNKTVLIIDDVIINGRTMDNVYEKLKDKFKKLDIWCIYCNIDAKKVFKFEHKLTHVEYVTESTWKKLSNHLTELIVDYNMGYVSFVNSYNLNISQNQLDEIEKNNQKMFIKNESIMLQNHKIECSLLFFDILPKNNDDNYKLKSVVRFNKKGDEFTVIPYVFLPAIFEEDCYNVCLSFLKAYDMKVSSKLFSYKDCNEYFTLIYMYTIYKLSEYVYMFFLNKNNLDKNFGNTPLFFCEESFKELLENEESFKELLENNVFSLDEEDFNDMPKIQNFGINTDEMLCCNLFSECLDNQSIINNEILKNSINMYLNKVKELDDNRADNGKERICGIRHESIMEILNNKISLSEEAIYAKEILFWENGKATCIVNTVEYNHKKVIACYMKNGEQAFRAIYDMYPLEYNILLEFNLETKELRKNQLFVLGEYLNRKCITDKFKKFITDIYKSEEQLYNDLLAVKAFSLSKNDSKVYNAFLLEINNIIKEVYKI